MRFLGKTRNYAINELTVYPDWICRCRFYSFQSHALSNSIFAEKTILFSKKTWFSVSYIKRMETWLDEHNNHVFRMGFHFPQDLLVISLFRKIHQNILRYIRQYPDRSLFHWIYQRILTIIFAIIYILADRYYDDTLWSCSWLLERCIYNWY